MMMFAGLDHRHPLPPFFPVYRGEDRVFAHMLGTLCDDAYFGHLAFTLQHLPAAPRRYLPIGAPPLTMADVIWVSVAASLRGIQQVTLASRFTAAANCLRELARLTNSNFRDWLLVALKEWVDARLSYWERHLLSFGSRPARWADALERHMRFFQTIGDPGTRPVDWHGAHDAGQWPARCRELLDRYAEVLRWWPAIIAAGPAVTRSLECL
jgi:hypothetical protein